MPMPLACNAPLRYMVHANMTGEPAVNTMTYSLCGMCGARCPVEVHCENGEPRWVCGNRKLTGSQGLCPRGAASPALYHDSARLRGPLIRTGRRGGGSWREADWDEALDYVAERLRHIMARHGSESVLLSEHPGPCSDMARAFMRAIGSPNHCTHDTSCAHNANQASFTLTGCGRGKLRYDYAHCALLVLQGRNALEAMNTGEARSILNARDAGCRLVCIDVRPTVTGAHADESITIRPGTDYAFNLAILHTLIARELYDAAFVHDCVRDFDALRDFVRPCSPAWAAGECDVPAETIIALAERLADAAPHVIWHGGWMTARYTQSFMTARSALLINALLGSYGAAGGLLFNDAPQPSLRTLAALYPRPAVKRADGTGWRRPSLAGDSGLLQECLLAAASGVPYPIKAYIATAHDPLTALPDPETQRNLLAAVDLLVAVTPVWSATAWHSDVILPAHIWLEQDAPIIARQGARPALLMQRAAVPPRHNTRPDWWIFGELARRLGHSRLSFASAEELWNFQLQGTGLTISDFADSGGAAVADTRQTPSSAQARAGGDGGMAQRPRFPTPSGRIEVICDAWEARGIRSLMPYVPVRRPSGNLFRLITGRDVRHTQARTQNNAQLHRVLPENCAWIAAERADALGIRDGDRIRITAANGHSGEIAVRRTEGMHPDALFMLHGFGHRLPMEHLAAGRGLADQEFMPGGLATADAASGGIALQEHFVTVAPCAARNGRG